MPDQLSDFLAALKKRYPSETEFHQAVTEVSKSVWPFVEKNPKYQKASRKILFGPGKAANAGGVSVSGLEMTQNRMRLQWTSDEVDKRLSDIMKAIHNQCVRFGERDGFINCVDGANTAGFRKVGEAMLDQGLV
jgi:glutamate dehydrogenase/leucine dehydrogenase